MNRLAPSHMASLIMGCWFFASATGNFVAGMIARATGSEAASGSDAAQAVVLEVYSKIGWIAIAVGVGFLVIAPVLKQSQHPDTLKDDNNMTAGKPERAGPDPPPHRPNGVHKRYREPSTP